jgi:endonuclease YncB( thermonuclease family)
MRKYRFVFVFFLWPLFLFAEDPYVYVTSTGKKYHTESCLYVAHSKIKILLSEALEKGYLPCKVCLPPTFFVAKNNDDAALIRHTLTGKIVGIVDGDTVTLLCHNCNQTYRIRLNGIDCPEKGQAYGTAAKQFTAHLLFSQSVSVHIVDIDRYGRYIADVYLGDTYVNAEIVKAGYAWHYKRYSDSAQLARCEIDARNNHRGLWQDAHPIPPWQFRK